MYNLRSGENRIDWAPNIANIKLFTVTSLDEVEVCEC